MGPQDNPIDIDRATRYLKQFFGESASLVVHPGIQTCPTFIAFTRDHSPFLFQFRPQHRALLDETTEDVVHRTLGNFAPSINLLEECTIDSKSYLIYEQSLIPGEAFSRLFGNTKLLPRAAEGVGRLLAKCTLPYSNAGRDRKWYDKSMKALDQACNTTDPLLTPYISDFEAIRSAVVAGVLDVLPLAVSNGDVSALNILMTKEGDVGGLVDWEMKFYDEQPLGTGLSAVHWIKCSYKGDSYEDYENTAEIEDRFWRGFYQAAPANLAGSMEALQLAMRLGVVLREVYEGESCFPFGVPTLRRQLDYHIPAYDQF